MRRIDLHTHSNCSDGTLTPSELLKYAIEKDLAAIALTDHDCVSGISMMQQFQAEMQRSESDAAIANSIEIIPGTELSTDYDGNDIHVVGLYIDPNDAALNKYLMDFVESRDQRNVEMCDALAKGTGFDISFDKLRAEFPGSVITRAHYGRYLLDRGYVKTMKEVFDKYIGDHAKYFVPRDKVSPMEAVKIIHSAGGLAILAHPVLYGFGKATLDEMVSKMKEAGLDGIEATYSTYAPSDERDIKALAKKYDLLLSGGSDFHGTNKPHIDLGVGTGHLFVPYEYLEKIKGHLSTNL